MMDEYEELANLSYIYIYIYSRKVRKKCEKKRSKFCDYIVIFWHCDCKKIGVGVGLGK